MNCVFLFLVLSVGVVSEEIQAKLPVLDFADFLGENKIGFVNSLGNALTGLGFYYVKNHGVDEAVLKRTVDEGYRFMTELSYEEKMKYAKDTSWGGDLCSGYVGEGAHKLYGVTSLRESFQTNSSNLENLKNHEFFGSVMYDYTVELKEFSQGLLRAYALAFGVDENFFHDKHAWGEGDASLDCGLINYYPGRESYSQTDNSRLGPHTDFLTISVLHQDREGLQIWDKESDRWESVPPVHGALVVNTGNVMQFWTNNHFVSSMHRVLTNEETSKSPRVSLVYFTGPQARATVDSKDLRPDEDRVHAAIVAGDYLYERMFSMYADDSELSEGFVDAEAKLSPKEAIINLRQEL